MLLDSLSEDPRCRSDHRVNRRKAVARGLIELVRLVSFVGDDEIGDGLFEVNGSGMGAKGDIDELSGIFGICAAIGHHHHHRFAGVRRPRVSKHRAPPRGW